MMYRNTCNYIYNSISTYELSVYNDHAMDRLPENSVCTVCIILYSDVGIGASGATLDAPLFSTTQVLYNQNFTIYILNDIICFLGIAERENNYKNI